LQIFLYHNEHSKEKCQNNLNYIGIKNDKITKAEKYSKFTSLDNIIYTDFETITIDNISYIYAISYAFGDENLK
jgi:hypothetical protein